MLSLPLADRTSLGRKSIDTHARTLAHTQAYDYCASSWSGEWSRMWLVYHNLGAQQMAAKHVASCQGKKLRAAYQRQLHSRQGGGGSGTRHASKCDKLRCFVHLIAATLASENCPFGAGHFIILARYHKRFISVWSKVNGGCPPSRTMRVPAAAAGVACRWTTFLPRSRFA